MRLLVVIEGPLLLGAERDDRDVEVAPGRLGTERQVLARPPVEADAVAQRRGRR